MADDATETPTTETPAKATRRRRRDARPAQFGEGADTAAGAVADTPLPGLEGDDDAAPLAGEVQQARRDTRRGDRHRARPGKSVTEGAAVIYTLVGTTFQMVGLHFAGYAMQAQADQAGPKLGKWAMTHPRARAMFERVGTGTDLAPLIAGPIVAEAYVRFEGARGQLAPLLGLLLPADAVETIQAVVEAQAQAAMGGESGITDIPLEGAPAPAFVDDVPDVDDAPARPTPSRGASKRRAGAGVRNGDQGEAAA